MCESVYVAGGCSAENAKTVEMQHHRIEIINKAHVRIFVLHYIVCLYMVITVLVVMCLHVILNYRKKF